MKAAGRKLLRMAALACGLAAVASPAEATAPALFGYGPPSAALAQSDIAFAQPSAAPFANPAFACAPGTRLSLGYGHGWTRLELDGREVPYRDIAGTDLALQLGRRLGKSWQIGGGVTAHLPDRSLAQISFRPGSEPTFVRFDPSPQRATADIAMALRYDRVAIGAGASVLVDAEGDVRFLMGQDGNGTYADGSTDVTLPYRIAPTAGASVDLGAASFALRYRGSQAVGVGLGTRADVQVSGNPLNGTTTVGVSGQSGYVPASWDAGAMWEVTRGVRLLGALQLARWSEAPPVAADLSLAVRLGLSPGQLQARFVRPALRDTLSPRAGVAIAPLEQRLVLRAGYAYSPSPVPEQAGLASWADAPAHVAALGGGIELGRAWGVELRADAAAQVWLLRERAFDKPSEVLPFAHYRAGGHLVHLAVGLEATWR